MAEFTPPTLGSEAVFQIGSFDVRNTLITSLMTLLILVFVGLILRRKKYALVPSGFQNIVETVIGGLFSFFNGISGDEKKTRKFFPLSATIFLYVIISNWMGLLPGFGSIGIWEEHEGHEVLVPIFRSTYADVNMTLALALIAMTSVQAFGIAMIGFKKYAGKFFINPLKSPIGCFSGFLEIVSEFSKIISFSFRLFGNVFAGEVLLLVISFLVPFLIPLPFYGLELFVGFIQALVFSFLTFVFLTMATAEHH